MEIDIESLSKPPPKFLRMGAYGLEKRGKTTLVMKLCALMSIKTKKRMAVIDVENMRSDWYDRLKAYTGQEPIFYPPLDKNGKPEPCSPESALKFVKACEEHPDIGVLAIDGMTALLQFHRRAYLEKNRRIPLNAYQGIDMPYKKLSQYMLDVALHWACTMREADDKVTIDDEEKVVGKKGKGGGFEFIPRLIAHCTMTKVKRGQKFVIEARDCKTDGCVRIESEQDKPPISGELEPLIELYT